MAPEGEIPPLVALIQSNIDNLVKGLETSDALLDQFGNKIATATADVETDVAQAKLDVLNANLARFGEMSESASVRLGGSEQVSAQLTLISSQLDAFGQKNETATVQIKDNTPGGTANFIQRIVTWAVALGPALEGVAAVGLGSLTALPGLIGGVGLAAGSTLLAFKGLGPAITAWNAAAANTGQSAATAKTQVAALEGALASLSPAGRQFVGFYETELRPALNQLQQTDQGAYLPGLTKTLETALPLLQTVQPYLIQAAIGTTEWSNSVAHFLTSAQGLREVNDILSSSERAMATLGDASLDVIKALGALGSQGGPVLQGIAQSVDNAASAFLRWTQDGNSEEFLRYIESVAPEVKEDFDELAKVVRDVAEDWAPLVPLWLSSGELLLKMADGLAKVNPQLVQMVPLVLLGAKGFGAISALAETNFLTKLAGGLGMGTGGVAAEADVAATKTGVLLANLRAIAAIGVITVTFELTEKLINWAVGGTLQAIQNARDATAPGVYQQAAQDARNNLVNGVHTTSGPEGPRGLVGPGDPGGPPTSPGNGKGNAGGDPTGLYAQGVAQTTAVTAAQKAMAAAQRQALTDLNSDLTTIHKQGQAMLADLVHDTTSKNLAALTVDVNKTHQEALASMVVKLNSDFKDEQAKLSTKLTTAQKNTLDQEMSDNRALATKLEAAEKAAQKERTTLLVAAATAAALALAKTLEAQAQLALERAQIADQAITDQASTLLATAQAGAQAVTDAARTALDDSNARAQAITDAAQIAIDTAAENGLSGADLLAAQAKVSLDLTEHANHAAMAAAQATYDSAVAMNNAALATAQAAFMQAQAAANQDIASGQLTLAIAEASGNATFIANAQTALAQEQQLAADTLANASLALATAQATAAKNLADAAAALSAVQGGNAIAEAAAQANYNTALAAAQAADAAAAAASSAASSTAASSTTSSQPIQITVISQIDGKQVALVTTPLIRQQLLRTTARQTQNILGGSAGRLVPA